MKSVKTIIIAGCLAAGVFTAMAFVNSQNEKALKAVQSPANNKGFAVVELFTSEGCSSCPPADQLIEDIQAENNNQAVYVLAFHVDYWDHQGWKDRFSNAAYSSRQRQYADWFHLESVYTPQIVVNGATETVGSSRGTVLKAINAGLQQEATSSLILQGKVDGKRLHVAYDAANSETGSELVLALVQQSAQSAVKAGENAGRKLSHVQIVRDLMQFPVNIKSKKDISFQLPQDFNTRDWELIGFVQNKENGHITAAARYDFDATGK